jgi:tetratricopeptide (TPR) repeat protein
VRSEKPRVADSVPPRAADRWEESTPRAKPPARPPPRAENAANAADDLYPDDSNFDVATEGQRPSARMSSDVSTSELKRQQEARPPPPPALKQAPQPLRATPPPPPEESLEDPDLTSPPSQESAHSHDDGTHDLPVSHASSAEILDSALVIRPAAKPGPKAAIARAADPVDDDDFMVDPDATMNLPARPKSLEGSRARGRPAAAPPPPPEPSGPSQADGQKNRRPPTEDMRRKARNLMEQAQKDHAIGRVGAARMNAKLATIYDPENADFKRILEAWEDKPKGTPLTASSMSRPEYVQLYEQAQDLEDEGDVDGALELLMKGVRLAPNAAAFHNRIGVILAMRKREFDRAAAEIQKAISLEPDNPHYRNNLGKVMQKANKRKVG